MVLEHTKAEDLRVSIESCSWTTRSTNDIHRTIAMYVDNSIINTKACWWATPYPGSLVKRLRRKWNIGDLVSLSHSYLLAGLTTALICISTTDILDISDTRANVRMFFYETCQDILLSASSGTAPQVPHFLQVGNIPRSLSNFDSCNRGNVYRGRALSRTVGGCTPLVVWFYVWEIHLMHLMLVGCRMSQFPNFWHKVSVQFSSLFL